MFDHAAEQITSYFQRPFTKRRADRSPPAQRGRYWCGHRRETGFANRPPPRVLRSRLPVMGADVVDEGSEILRKRQKQPEQAERLEPP